LQRPGLARPAVGDIPTLGMATPRGANLLELHIEKDQGAPNGALVTVARKRSAVGRPPKASNLERKEEPESLVWVREPRPCARSHRSPACVSRSGRCRSRTPPGRLRVLRPQRCRPRVCVIRGVPRETPVARVREQSAGSARPGQRGGDSVRLRSTTSIFRAGRLRGERGSCASLLAAYCQ
jgi:hypothetical protein